MKFRIIIFLFVLTAGCQKQAVKPEKDQLRLGFQNPPLSIRPRAFLTLPDDFADTFQITKNLQNIKNNGMGGLYLLFDTGELYTSPGDSAPNTNESIETFTRTLRAARELGLELGLVLTGSERQPQNGTMGMFTTTKVVRGPADIKIFFPAPLNEIKTTLKNNGSENLLPVYKNIAVLAYPVSGDSIIPDTSRIFTLTHAFHNDTLNWHVPSGWWKICRYDCANTGQKIHFPGHGDIGTAVDLLSHTALRDQVEFYLSAMQTKIDSI
ncbi:hypothetical protein JW935_18725, partial [candidate division KSB1 bacterium]|nr:hypothetical protein [candidate division KSB1 bacterium]